MDETFRIETLGPARVASPLELGSGPGDYLADFTPDDARVVGDVSLATLKEFFDRGEEPPSMERAGPRHKIYFDPSKLKVGIVTCGGLCPGINDVIRAELERVGGGKVATS